jgi:hypothetical protein
LAVVLAAGGLLASNMGFKLNYPLNATQAGVSLSGTTTIALPDNRQSGINSASALMNDISLVNTANVQKFLQNTDGLQIYTGRKGTPGADFALVPGEAYFVKMNTTVNYIPSHY